MKALNKTRSQIAIALGLTLTASMTQADHIDAHEAQHLLQWDQRQQFFDSWLSAKQQSKPLLKGLLEGHSEVIGNYRTTKTLAEKYLSLDQLNRHWLVLAIDAYQRRDWLDVQHSLSQLLPPLNPLISPSATLLQQVTSMRMQQPSDSVAKTMDPEFSALVEYNQALTLIDSGQTSQALALTEQIEKNYPLRDSGLADRTRLLRAYTLAQQPAKALQLLQGFSPAHPLFSLKQQIEALIHLNRADTQSHLDLLLKHSQQSPQQLSATNIQLLNELRNQGAQTQAALLAGQWLLPLQRQYIALLEQVKRVNSTAFLEQLEQRQSGDAVTERVSLLSKDSRLLLSEIERINFLLKQFKQQISFMQPQQQLFKQGRNYLKNQLHKLKSFVPNTGTRLPETILQGNPDILELESRLSELVGQPQPWPQRYVLLDGIAVWHTSEPFKHRWWEQPADGQPSDLKAANQELTGFTIAQFSQTSLLEELRIEQELPKLPRLEQRAKGMLMQLANQKKRLLAALAESLQLEPSQMVAELENKLLWLSTLIAPRAHQFDQPEQQRWFGPEQSEPGARPADTAPPYELALSALQALADNALNTQIQDQSIRHLADLKLLVSERILNGDPIPPRADITPESAISLYLKLLERPNPAINRVQILYQLAKSYELSGQPQQSLAALQQLISAVPDPQLLAEAQFRIAELQFGLSHFDLAAQSYQQLLESDDSGLYIDKARYKLAWSLFKQGQYAAALDDFFILVERHWQQPGQAALDNAQASQTLLDDTLRVVALTFAYMDGAHSVQQHFSQREPKPYEAQVYRNLGAYFEYKYRYTDTAEVFNAMVERFPLSEEAPLLQSRVVAAYTEGGFPSKAWPAREHFIERFGVNSQAWKQADPAQRDRIREHLAGYLVELAQRDHALAQQSAKLAKTDAEALRLRRQHFTLAQAWYDQFISAMPADPRLAEMLFLKAEALSETGQTERSSATYEQVAYQHPLHPRSAEAGYAALLAYQSLYQSAASNSPEAESWLQTGIKQSQRFSQAFADSTYIGKVQTKLAEDLLIQNNPIQAISTATALLQRGTDLDIELQRRLWRVNAHAHFDAKQYPDAEQAYQQLLLLGPTATELEPLLRRLAESIYQQGEQAQHEGALVIALGHYQRLGQVVPGAHIQPQADFDAATLLQQLERWPETVAALQRFSQDYPGHPLQATIDDKQVIAYEQTQNWPAAAQTLQRIFEREGSSALGRDALWRSATLQEKANQLPRAIQAYQRFIETFPSPHEPAMEARLKLYQLAKASDDNNAQQRWLQAMLATEVKAGTAKGLDASTDRSLFIASDAALTLGKQALAEFQLRPLDLPLQKSLPRKRESMQTSIRYLTQTSNFGLSSHSTEATALIGQLYQQFAQALMSSQRPLELDDLALEQYDILLEEQALPFEDKAISLHEINVGRISQDIYTPGIASSLEQLRQMMPARYAKDERVPEYTDALD